MTPEEIRVKVDELKKLIDEGYKALALIGAAGSEQERARVRQIQAVLNEMASMLNLLEQMSEFHEEMGAEIVFEDKSAKESHQPESSSGNI